MKLEDLPETIQKRVAVIHNNFGRITARELRDIIVFHEKHGDRYCRFDTLETVQSVSLRILKDRLDSEWIYEDKNPPTPLDFDKEDIKNFPESLQQEAYTKLKIYNRKLEDFELSNYDYYLAKYAIDNNDGRVAWNVLRNRQDYQYENYSLENFEKCTLDQQH